jgi:hypothetical protein
MTEIRGCGRVETYRYARPSTSVNGEGSMSPQLSGPRSAYGPPGAGAVAAATQLTP